ncbi:MAG: GH116 family glycosyl-hydrolase, partial [Planctomycetota bacterium]
MRTSDPWPCNRSFDQDHLHAISLPLGGIGTGTIGLGGRGQLCDWECFNAPSKGFIPCLEHRWAPFPLLWWRDADGQVGMRCLEG